MKIKNELTLPKPPKRKKHEWKPVVRIGRTVPWGYVEDPDDKNVLLPVEHELELLERAKKELKKYSYRAVANWLSTQTGRRISDRGLAKRLQIERKRTNNAASYRRFEKQAKKAAEKAKKLEERYGGSRAKTESGDGSGSSET